MRTNLFARVGESLNSMYCVAVKLLRNRFCILIQYNILGVKYWKHVFSKDKPLLAGGWKPVGCPACLLRSSGMTAVSWSNCCTHPTACSLPSAQCPTGKPTQGTNVGAAFFLLFGLNLDIQNHLCTNISTACTISLLLSSLEVVQGQRGRQSRSAA